MELGHGIIRVVPTGESLSKGPRVSIKNLHFSGWGWKLELAGELSRGGSPGGTLGSKVGNLWVTIQRDLSPPKSCEHQSSSSGIGLTFDCSLVLRLQRCLRRGCSVNAPSGGLQCCLQNNACPPFKNHTTLNARMPVFSKNIFIDKPTTNAFSVLWHVQLSQSELS